MATPEVAALDGGAAKIKSSKRLVGRQSAQTMPPVCAWTSRGQIQSLNDALTGSAMDRIEFWQGLVAAFWAEGPAAAAIRLTLGGEAVGSGSSLNGNPLLFDGGGGGFIASYNIPTGLVAHFFHTWAASTGMTRLHFDFPQAKEGKMPGGLLSFLATNGGFMDSLLLEGSLLIRQYLRGRFLFDPRGSIAMLELHTHSHDEFFLSLRAGHLVAANFNFMMAIPERPFVCRLGFPASVHRILDVMLTMGELFPPLPASAEEAEREHGTWGEPRPEGGAARGLGGRRRRRSPVSIKTGS